MPSPRSSVLALVPMTFLSLAPLALLPVAAQAQQAAARLQTYHIAAGSLSSVLNEFSSQAGIYLAGSDGLANGKRSAGLEGEYSIDQALALLLGGTGLVAVPQGAGGYVLQPSAAGDALQLDATSINGQGIASSLGQEDKGYRATHSAAASKTSTEVAS